MADTQRTHAIPQIGKSISVRVTPELRQALAILMTPGGTASDAVRLATSLLADAYHGAWATGRIPHGTAPIIDCMMIRRPKPDTDQAA
ncbi:hypothetical protein [Streptomyces sp. NPDC002644]